MSRVLSFLILLIAISGCSYTPIYSDKESNFKIDEINFEGEKFINEIIKNSLETQAKGDKKYNIYFKTIKNRQIVSSDIQGDPKIFKIKIILEYKLYHNDNKISEDKIVKQTSYNSIDDKYELSQYENNILKNLSKIISDEILFSIKLLENDN
tara:strand:- start:3112 stop:3570 length:459 start_codon:yes stop_codon:yes gene_type:complete